MSSRPSWDRYFMDIARMVGTRSTCIRRNVGAIAVNGRRILATGYNGTPKGLSHCSEVGCIREKLGILSGQRHELCRGLHAEQNCIIQAAVHGVQLEGSTIYCTFQPCVVCAKMLINAGITEIVYEGGYPDDMSVAMLEEAGISLKRLGPDDEEAKE
jgi:dCMP deaminase